jgi:hypothetical protein
MLSRAAGLSAVLVLVGCGAQVSNGGADATPSSPGVSSAPTKPTSTFVAPPLSPWPTASPGAFEAQVVWQRDELVVTAFGSSLCQPVARSAVAVDEHTVVVVFAARADDVACTDDFAPHRSRVAAPAGGIDLSGDVYAAFNLDGAARQLVPIQLRHPRFS